MRTSLLATLTAVWLIAASAAAMPVVLVEDFEGAPPASIGDVFLDAGGVGVGPIEGSQQAVLTTSLPNGAVPEQSVEDAFENSVWPEDLPNNVITKIWKDFLRQPGLSSKGDGPTEGSALQITFSADANDVLELDYDFLTNDASRDPFTYTDFAWYYLDRPSGPGDDGVLAHTNQGGFTSFGGPDYTDHTGLQTFTLTLAQTGTYTITLGVNEVQDSLAESALVIDWIRLVKGPEPGTFGLLAAGLGALSLHSRRRRKSAI